MTFVLVASLLVATVSGPEAETFVAIPGTSLELLQPPGFTVSKRFSGLERRDRGASVTVAPLPIPFGKGVAGFTKEHLEHGNKMKLLSREEAEIAGTPGLLLNLTLTVNGVDYEKWVCAFGTDQKTVLVTATFPAEHSEALSHTLRDALRRTRWK